MFAFEKVRWLIPSIIISISMLAACSDGCPAGMRDYGGECVPETSNQTRSDPDMVPDVDGDQLPIDVFKPQTPPPSYNEAPTTSTDDIIVSDRRFNIEIGEDDAAVIAWIEGNRDNIVLPNHIEDPEGNVVYDLTHDIQDGAINDNYSFHYYPDSSVSLYIPNTPLMQLKPGMWSFEVASIESGNEISLKTFNKEKRPAGTDENHLSVNLWFVDLEGLDSDSASENTQLTTALKVFRECMATAGITIDSISFKDVRGDIARQTSVINGYEEFKQLMRYSENVGNSWPNIFLIRGFDGTELGGVLGLASHIPGPPGVQGSDFSGVAVSVEFFDMYPRIHGLAIAHELAHWLGLFHTTEYNGEFHDSLEDTPKCSSTYDDNVDGMMDWYECAEHGAPNIMFWLVPMDDNFPIGPRGSTFSADQSWVLQNNPIIHFQ